ncbi:hypothetical protein [Deinococcus sp. Marseille-Q6407]|uniref:hypothetical protein n=1 Tax=Deinococcus sp. Marseille-Q6407 TaxID=2969223 RepID=UPI0021C1F0B1|nr:hypothetical protein [Deinococcus sp. Marseille-Q6407]
MTNEQAFEKAFAGFTAADFATEQEVREAVQSLRETNPEWNLDEAQEEQIVAYWNSQQ